MLSSMATAAMISLLVNIHRLCTECVRGDRGQQW